MVKVVTTLLLLMYLISTCIAANNRRDDDENMPGLHGNESLRTKAHIAHGTVISIAIVLFFPLGATMVPLFSTKNILWWHMVWQMTGMFILLVGFGLGCWLSYPCSFGIEAMRSLALSSSASSFYSLYLVCSTIATSR